jgi:hypothetical protein
MNYRQAAGVAEPLIRPIAVLCMMVRGMRALIALALLLSGCNSNGIPAPSVGQWVAYGGTEPTINQGPPMSFAFPGPNQTAGYFYTQLPIVPKTGQTLTLTFSVDGSNPVWQNNPNGGDSGAPTMHLFLWRKGDDLSCNGDLAQYRMFAARTPLVLGDNQIISVPLATDTWTGCYAAHSTDAQWSDLLNNLLGAGFTFGGQNFAGHGLYLSTGSATFKVNSFTVQ